ncbi:hypothetical protein PINS_up008373 [Pythium insidiosum]|nr:hypothetical protein PINS_up008373 [Pythium insidiosum]
MEGYDYEVSLASCMTGYCVVSIKVDRPATSRQPKRRSTSENPDGCRRCSYWGASPVAVAAFLPLSHVSVWQLIPRTILHLFARIDRLSQTSSSSSSSAAVREYSVKCSFLQIYNEQILDLLSPTTLLQSRKPRAGKAPPGLRLRWSALRDFYVENLCVLECSSPEQVLQHFQDGVKRKIMASHQLNAASSRSHCVFTLYVESSSGSDSGGDSHVLQSKLALVDLAGSERVDKTGATGVTLQESIGINKSLFVLRQVIQALSEEGSSANSSTNNKSSESRAYIPYRDSKLTSLLKYSLGGNSWTLMVACLSPSDAFVDENLSTLVYASKAQAIANHPTKNEDPKTLLIQELRREVESLRTQLAQAHEVILQFQRPPSSAVSAETTVVQPEVEAVQVAKHADERSQQEEAEDTSVSSSLKVSSTRESNATTTKLKMSVIDNVEMIKRLYATEKELRARLVATEATTGELRHENRVLHVENQSLREKMEVLEYLVAHATQPQHDDMPEQDDGELEIPEYGALTANATALTMPAPSAERVREVLRRSVGGRGTNKVAPDVSSSSRDAVTPRSSRSSRQQQGQRAPPRPRPEKETGLLSVREQLRMCKSRLVGDLMGEIVSCLS